jgi:adenosylcobyric acid synthase
VPLAPTLMIQGTASSVGKSLLVTALCRLFKRDGINVAPFKSQNMALNSAVTPDGLEIGRAQAVQAEAAGLVPCVEMNPILIKPEGHQVAQIVLMGRPAFRLSAAEYHERKPQLHAMIADCLATLRRRHDLVIIEGAGSPAEINLKDRDIVNMHVARLADAPVLLVGDIDRGGVFAAFVGTLELLEPDERERVRAFVINKFRGDLNLLTPGLDFLRQRTGKPVLGVVPYLPELRIADEDSLSLESRAGRRRPGPERLDIVVVGLPHLSNYDDVAALEHESGVTLRFAHAVEELEGADLVILPGTKSTVADLGWLRDKGLAQSIERRARAGGLILGICGGCQMLGDSIADPDGVESAQPNVPGLGLLSLSTRFDRNKVTAQCRARVLDPSFLGAGVGSSDVKGYEIHMGQISVGAGVASPFEIISRNGTPTEIRDGAINAAGNVVGTILHGVLEHAAVRASLLGTLRQQRGLGPPAAASGVPSASDEYDRLEASVRQSLDLPLLRRLAQVG